MPRTSIHSSRRAFAGLLVAAPVLSAASACSNETRVLQSAPPEPSPALPPPARTRLGVNLQPLTDSTNDFVFTNLVQCARGFARLDDPSIDRGVGAKLGPDGWPIEDFLIYFANVQRDGQAHRCSFSGGAADMVVDVRPGPGVKAELRDMRRDPSTGVTTFTCVVTQFEGDNDYIGLAFTRTGGGVKDLRLMAPGYALDAPRMFTDEFLAFIAPYATVRTMDWQATNGNLTLTHWADRPTLSSNRTLTQYYNVPRRGWGVPMEVLVQLAKEGGKDLWVCVPTAASDDYVTQLATLLRDTLPATSCIYVEYSNETWNTGVAFTQSRFHREAAVAHHKAHPEALRIRDDHPDDYQCANRFMALKIRAISERFRAVWGDAAMMTRVRPVLAGQGAGGTSEPLEILARDGAVARTLYGIAQAPYAFLGSLRDSKTATAAQFAAELAETAARARVDYNYEYFIANAVRFGIRALAYEGSPSTEDNAHGENVTVQRTLAVFEPRFQQACSAMLRDWIASGGDLFCWYWHGAEPRSTVARYGFWSTTDRWANTTAPKIAAMREIEQAAIAPDRRNSIPGVWDGRACVGRYGPHEGPYPAPHTGFEDSWYFTRCRYTGHALDVRPLKLVVTVASDGLWKQRTWQIYFNGRLMSQQKVMHGRRGTLDLAAVQVMSRAGINVVEIVIAQSSRSLTVTRISLA